MRALWPLRLLSGLPSLLLPRPHHLSSPHRHFRSPPCQPPLSHLLLLKTTQAGPNNHRSHNTTASHPKGQAQPHTLNNLPSVPPFNNNTHNKAVKRRRVMRWRSSPSHQRETQPFLLLLQYLRGGRSTLMRPKEGQETRPKEVQRPEGKPRPFASETGHHNNSSDNNLLVTRARLPRIGEKIYRTDPLLHNSSSIQLSYVSLPLFFIFDR